MISNSKFIISKNKIIKSYNQLKNLSDIVSYSVKSNPYITHVLEENTNSRFLIHHINELKYIKDKSKIYFMLHAPEDIELKTIFENNIVNIIIDNENDLYKLLEFIKNKNIKINLFLRMRIKEHSVNTGKYFVYGMYSTDVNKFIKKLKENININSLGIHFHRKTQNLSEWDLINELKESINKETFEIIDFLDIGGGIPSFYKNTSPKVIDNIFEKILNLKEFLNKQNIKLIIEPGRAIAAPSSELITNIKSIIDNNIFIDASVYNCSMDTIVTDLKLNIKNEVEFNNSNKIPYLIKGLTPASEDIFRYRVYFKEKPKVGDKIIFINAGAYIYYTDLFNLEKPKIEFVD